MINYYRKSIITMLTQVHRARVSPFENAIIWHLVQEKLIKQISRVEFKIRILKDEIKGLNFKRKNPQKLILKEESIIIKNQLNNLEYKLEEYRRLIKIYKSIGDAIAFTFIHKLDIKPQNFKQSSGFITDKVGFKKEKQWLRYAFKKGVIAILNDLTSVLKYCDITIVSENGFFPLEVKSSENVNSRVERQKSNANKLFSYIFEDKTDSLYGVQGIMQRVALQSEEVNYIYAINELIDNSLNYGFAYKLVETGVLYFVAHQDPNEIEDSKKMFEEAKLNKPIAFFLNGMKFNEMGYYPFSLSFTNPDIYFDFLQGNFVINIFIDFDVISQIANQNGFSFHESDDIDYPFEFRSVNDEIEFPHFKISNHFFSRVIVEFVSLNWLLTDTFKRFNHGFLEDPQNN